MTNDDHRYRAVPKGSGFDANKRIQQLRSKRKLTSTEAVALRRLEEFAGSSVDSADEALRKAFTLGFNLGAGDEASE